MKRFLLLSFLYILTALSAVLIKIPKQQNQQLSPSVLSQEIIVSAYIGENPLAYSLFGYTSSYAEVSIQGMGVLEKTQSNKDGYFIFKNFLAPSSTEEICMYAVDIKQRVTQPLCVPLPSSLAGQSLGPYLLPPSIELSTGEAITGDSVIVSGSTIPNTDIKIHSFYDKPRAKLYNASVYAGKNIVKNNKIINEQSSSDGTFSTSLQPFQTGKIRIFAQSVFNLKKTPKSNTLTVSILSTLLAALLVFWSWLSSLFNINTILIAQVIIILLLILKRIRIRAKQKNAIVPFKKNFIVTHNFTPIALERYYFHLAQKQH